MRPGQEGASASALEGRIGYTFQNGRYLDIALTHSSYANEVKKNISSNERQEFLGDAVLSIVVSDYLFHTYHLAEGDLTKLRAALVCEKSLWEFSQALGLGDFLKLGRGEEMMGGRTRPSILADAFEALIAAIYLDGGIEPARRFVLGYIVDALENRDDLAFSDYKTMLQEIIQKNPEERLSYVLVNESGPDHNKKFLVEVRLNSNVIGVGCGGSKKSAEQAGAREALKLVGRWGTPTFRCSCRTRAVRISAASAISAPFRARRPRPTARLWPRCARGPKGSLRRRDERRRSRFSAAALRRCRARI